MKELVKKIFKFIYIKMAIVLVLLGFTGAFSLKAYAGENINVAFTIDHNYPLYTMLVIDSILKNNVSHSDYTFYVINDNLTYWDKFKMTMFVKSKKQKIKFITVDTNAINKGKNPYKKTYFCTHVTSIGTARMMIPKLLPDDVKKILYLDSDIIVLQDLKELYDTDLGKYYAAMALDNSYLYLTDEEKRDCTYGNSGVILMDLDKWRKDNISEKIIDYATSRQLSLPDQDAINKILEGKIKLLNSKWNNQACDGYSFLGIDETAILHYISYKKPWVVFESRKNDSYLELYYNYWENSPLSIYILTNAYNLFIKKQKKQIYTNRCAIKNLLHPKTSTTVKVK